MCKLTDRERLDLDAIARNLPSLEIVGIPMGEPEECRDCPARPPENGQRMQGPLDPIHLGDGAYASRAGWGGIILTANHHDPRVASDTVAVEPEALMALIVWACSVVPGVREAARRELGL